MLPAVVEKQTAPTVDAADPYEDDGKGFLPVERLNRQYLDYVGTKQLEIDEQKIARHYYHGNHWTAEEIRVLKKRRQPIVTYNRINRKVDGIVGLVERLRQDPKAFPRNPKDGEQADVATQAIRYVLDSNDWKTIDHDATERCAIEGIGGIELKLVEGDHDDADVAMDYVFGEDWFYDPRSRKPDFSDGRYHGIAKWIDAEAATDLFPDKADQIKSAADQGFDLTTHSDQLYKWVYTNERRVRLVEHWYQHKGRWCWCFYIGPLVLAEGVSPFRDEHDKPMSRFLMWSAAVDHDLDRYGFVRNMKGPQDEINQRRSKALHISNSRRIISEKGAVDDVETARREWARPDGWLEVNPGFGDKIKPDDQQQDLSAQLEFLNEAKNEIDSFANVNPALLAESDPAEHSGVAIDLMQRAGLAELSKFLLAHRSWKLRVYRAIWNIIRQHWTAERWIRVTDDQNVKQFIQLNGLGVDQLYRPIMINALGALDVDIVLDEGPDVVSVMQDAYQIIKDDPNIPAVVKIEASPLPNTTKQRLLGLIQQASQNQPPDPKVVTEQIKQRTEMAKGQIEIQKEQIAADAERFNAAQDALSRQQDMQLEREDAANRRQELAMEMRFKQEQHLERMQELAMKARVAQQQHANKMRESAQRTAN